MVCVDHFEVLIDREDVADFVQQLDCGRTTLHGSTSYSVLKQGWRRGLRPKPYVSWLEPCQPLRSLDLMISNLMDITLAES